MSVLTTLPPRFAPDEGGAIARDLYGLTGSIAWSGEHTPEMASFRPHPTATAAVVDHLRRLMQSGVHHLVACIGESAGHDLGSAVVTVESRFGNENAKLALLRHGWLLAGLDFGR